MKYSVISRGITLEVDRELARCICWAISLATGRADADDTPLTSEQIEYLHKLSETLWKSVV